MSKHAAISHPALTSSRVAFKTESSDSAVRQPLPALTELAGCIMFGVACVDMWLGVYTLIRVALYLTAVALAFVGGGFKLRMPSLGRLFVLAGGLYLLKALLYPPIPSVVRSDMRNIIVGCALLGTLNLSDLTVEGWERFQRKIHRTVLSCGTLGAVLGLAKFLYFIQGGIISRLMDPELGYPLGSSLQQDYNFYCLPLLLALFSAFYLMKRDPSSGWRTAALLCVPALVAAVLLSFSRRGLTIISTATPLLVLWALLTRKRPHLAGNAGRIRWKSVALALVLMTGLGLWKLDAVSEFCSGFFSADSLVTLTKRWQTFQDGTYSDSRVHHWSVTMERLARFRPLEYVFGEGFAYVTDLGADPDVEEDYPHNFLLSSMLYGGVLQTGVILVLVVVALSRLARRATDSGMLGLWFVTMLYFLMTSCNSFFSCETAVFLAVLGLGIRRFGLERAAALGLGTGPIHAGLTTA